jgi:hypothetical protein
MCHAVVIGNHLSHGEERVTYKIDTYVYVCAVQEIRWPGKGTVIKKNYIIFYSGRKNNKNEFGTRFCISRHIMHNFSDFEPV